MKSLRKGFTLVELMVVIVIIGILAALAIPRVLGATNKSKATEFKPVLKQIYTLEEAYRQEHDAYGTSKEAIGFDDPPGKARFGYTITGAATNLGSAMDTVVGGVKSLSGLDLKGTSVCIDSTVQMWSKNTDMQSVASLTYAPTTACP